MIDLEVIHRIQKTLTDRKGSAPESSYVASLYAKGTDSICKKVAEEAAEAIMAAKESATANPSSRQVMIPMSVGNARLGLPNQSSAREFAPRLRKIVLTMPSSSNR
ncbi:MAG: phosphoribosyl-ATP diphosphatase [Rhodocyclaceae bacterium]|nr:MAG: phosphoribosyl-ATP diphosphatase [Rhodocyclaceae bacterium]